MTDSRKEGPWGPIGKKENRERETQSPWTEDKPHGQKENNSTPPFMPQIPPDIEKIWNKIKLLAKSKLPKDRLHLVFIIIGTIAALWFLSGFYLVAADQTGVVMRFGALARTEPPGLRYHLPYPIEEVLLPVVTAQNEIPIGFRKQRISNDKRSVPEESMMLTQDENLINVEFTVFWRISDVIKYLFEIRDPQQTIKAAAESVMREVIGQNKLQFALTEGRSQIAEEARSRLQALLDEYNAGVIVSQINLQTVSVPDEVKAAFQDVINARLDNERFQNQAAAHVNKVIPDAKGKAAQMLQQALAYRDQKISLAKGEAERFKEILAATNFSREVAMKRLYLETMETVLGKSKKIILDKNSGATLLPYLPFREYQQFMQQPKTPTSTVREGEQQ